MHPTPPNRQHGARAVGLASVVACLAFSSGAQAAVTFSFSWDDPAGTGFKDPVSGASRQAALTDAANLFSTLFGTYFSNTGAVVLSATASSDPLSNTLASAGSQLTLAGGAPSGFNIGEVVKTKIITGTDLNGAGADGTVNVNFGQPWQLSAGATVTSGQFDFYSTIFHEFTHALGFSSSIDQNGTSLFGTNNWVTFDQFLSDKNGAKVIAPGTFALDGSVWNTGSVGGTSPAAGLFFDGPNAMAANGGQRVGLYTPTTWADGSSVSHIDTDNPAYAGMMMLHATTTGPGARVYSAIEVGILQDLGYTLAAPIPEPSTWALWMVGFGAVGAISRRRRAAA